MSNMQSCILIQNSYFTEHQTIDGSTKGALRLTKSMEKSSLPPKADAPTKVRRPMNAFMLFAKRHRCVVRDYYPNYDNRTISKILSEWWYALKSDCKQKYRDLADEIKAEHYRVHPTFEWKTVSTKATDSSSYDADAMQYLPKNYTPTLDTPMAEHHQANKWSVADSVCSSHSIHFARFQMYSLKQNCWFFNSQVPIGGESSRDSFESAVRSFENVEQPPTSKMEQDSKSGPVSTPIGVRRSDRQQKQMLAKASSSKATTNANASESLNDKSSALFNERFHLLPQFDHGNYKSPTQWPAFGVQRPQKRVSTDSGTLQESPANKYARNVMSYRKGKSQTL